MGERAVQIAVYPRQMTQILRLAVAAIEPREDAQDLGGALRSQRRVELQKFGGAETRMRGLAGPDIAAEQRHLQLLGNVDPGILEQRYQVVGGRPEQRVLEIEQADASHALSLRNPKQIGGMIVAQHPGLRRLDGTPKRCAPQRLELGS